MRSCHKLNEIASSSKAAFRPVPLPQDGSTTPPIHLWLSYPPIVDQLIDWAMESKENLGEMKIAVQGGIRCVFGLACLVTRFTLNEIRSLHKQGYQIYISNARQAESRSTNTLQALIRRCRNQGVYYLNYNYNKWDAVVSVHYYEMLQEYLPLFHISSVLQQRQEKREEEAS